MRNATVDIESFYDPANGYGLKHLTTEDYVTSPLFEFIWISVMMDDEKPKRFTGTLGAIKEWIKQFKLHECAVTCHHARFDVLCMFHHLGINPRFIFCTESMANPSLKPRLKSLSLANLCIHFGLPPKGDEVIYAMGKRRADFYPDELERYGQYCDNDVERTRELFKILRPRLNQDELRLLDMTIRMYVMPQLTLDASAFDTGLRIATERKDKMHAEMEVQGITKKMLSSGEQFAQILRDRGIDPPMKQSPTWLKKPEDQRDPAKEFTYAFGKTDPEFLQLREDFAEDEEITALLDARTETKSTQEQTRCTKFAIKARKHGVLRAAAVYYGAHTGRYTGDEGENILNLTNVGKHKDKVTGQTVYKSMLRFGITAPPDHDVLAADLAQIEARVTAALSGQDDLIQDFANGVDVYSVFASDLYGRLVSKALAEDDPQAEKDRKSGKETILGAGFGMGPAKFRRTVRGKGLILTEEEAAHTIYFYRERYPSIKEQWGVYTQAVNDLIQYREDIQVGPVRFTWDTEEDAAIVLPNGMKILYPGLHASKGRDGKPQAIFKRARDKWPQKLWGGVVMENLAQSLSRIIIVRNMLDIYKETGYRTALQIYDEVVLSVRKSETARVKAAVEQIMVRPVSWLPDLPIAVEAKVGPSYGHV